MESQPVQARLKIWHDAAGDTCEALLTKMLYFDLGPLEDAFKASYPGADGQIIVHLEGHGQVALHSF